MLEACLEYFFFFAGGRLVPSFNDLPIPFLFLFTVSLFLYLCDGLIVYGNSQRAFKSKRTNLPAIQGN